MAIQDLPPVELRQTLDAMSLGSQAAYSRFFMHYRNKLFPFVRQIGKDDHLADEAVSKTGSSGESVGSF